MTPQKVAVGILLSAAFVLCTYQVLPLGTQNMVPPGSHFTVFSGPTIFASSQGICSSKSTFTSASLGNVAAGDSILVFVSMAETSATTVSTIDSTVQPLDVFTSIGQVTLAGVNMEQVFEVSSSSGGTAYTVTVVPSATVGYCVGVIVLTGANNHQTYDVVGLGSTGANTTAGDPQTTTKANDLVFMGAAIHTTSTSQTVSQLGSWAIAMSSMTVNGLGTGTVDLLKASPTHCYPQITISTSLSWSAISVSAAVTAAPQSPTSLTSGAVTEISIAIFWTNAPGAITNVSVYRWASATCTGTVTTTSLGGSGTSSTQTGLSPDVEYSFEVADWNSTGSSVPSSCLVVYTLPNAPVVIPPVLTAVGATGTTVLASWSAPVNVTFGHYALYYGSVYGTWALSASGLTALEATVSGLVQNTSYFLQVDAYTVLNTNLSQSNIAVAHTLSNIPAVILPSILSCAGASTTTVVCDWSAVVNLTVANYSLNHGTSFGSYPTHVTQGSSTFETVTTGLSANTTYFFVVVAWSASIVISTSNVASAHTLVAPPATQKVVLPPILTATGISTATVAVSWGAAQNVTVANYTLEYGTAYGTYPTHISEGASTFETVVTGLAVNATYWFIVYAGTSGAYNIVASNVVSAHTLPAGSSTGVNFPVATAAAVNTTTISVSWRAPTGTVTNYTLEYARFYGIPIAYISVGAHTVYNVTNLGFNLTYYFTVWAWNGTGQSPPSNVAVAETQPAVPVVPPFPWLSIYQLDTIETVGAFAISCALAVWISGKRGDRHARGGATVALAQSRRPSMPGGSRAPPPSSRSYVRMAPKSRFR